MSQRPVVIFGTGDFARIAARYLTHEGGRTVVAFTVDGKHVPNPPVLLDLPVIPFEELAQRHLPEATDVFVAIGFSRVNEARAEVCERVRAAGYALTSFVSPRACVAPDVEIGDNVFIFEQNVVQPFVQLGHNVILWSGNHVGHDSVIEDHCFIASHAVISGNVRIGHHSFVGVNATFRDGITVGPRAVIGAGAVIMKDVEEGAVHAVRHTEAHPKKSWELDI